MLVAETAVMWGKPFLRAIAVPRPDRIVIFRRRRFVRNSFRTFAFVTTHPGGRGTRIDVTLRSAYIVAGFMTFWLGFATLFNVPILMGAIGGGGQVGDLLFTVPFPLFGFGLIAFGRWETRPDGPALLDFIRQTTDARDLPPELVPSS
jgi:hypothetical protein